MKLAFKMASAALSLPSALSGILLSSKKYCVCTETSKELNEVAREVEALLPSSLGISTSKFSVSLCLCVSLRLI